LVPVGFLVVTALIIFLDVRWVQAEMSKPGWDGTPDMDIIFDIGVLMRVLNLNTILLPITGVGILLRRRKFMLRVDGTQ